MFDLILIKFREKKTLIIEETKVSIENFWYSLIIDEVVEEIKLGLLDKAPPMKM